MESLCPLCKTVLDTVYKDLDPWQCCKCGMHYLPTRSTYKKDVGEYVVIWIVGNYMQSNSRIYGSSGIPNTVLLWRGSLLPFDVSEDMIKIMLTFS